MSGEFQVTGNNPAALFTLKLHRGDGMTLVAMNWKKGEPPRDFVGFAIEYKEPGGHKFFPVKNRLSFAGAGGQVNPNTLSTRLSPIQKFRWVHFPRKADLPGEFVYRVTPVFMNDAGELSYGDEQEVAIELRRETYPGQLNVTFTRGFMYSQSFVDRFQSAGPLSTLLPAKAADGLKFTPTHGKTEEALAWMGFEARQAILEVLDEAIADETAQVRVVAYDLNEPGLLSRLEKLGDRLKVIIDDSDDHGEQDSCETEAEGRLKETAGEENVKRQRMLGLQHNKTIVVFGPKTNRVVCGSTNFSWRAFFVQSNNAVVLSGEGAVKPFLAAFEEYWKWAKGGSAFGDDIACAKWISLGLEKIDASVAFSPHADSNALLQTVADDMEQNTTSCLFYSLAFLSQTGGPIKEAIRKLMGDDKIFMYGIADRKVKDLQPGEEDGGIELLKPDGTLAPVFPSSLTKNVPEPFKSEPSAGGVGTRMHHKFVVIDFDKPTARVYLGSYNFSSPADLENGENLLLIRDRRVATAYTIEALRIFDHYHFRVAQNQAATAQKSLVLAKPPSAGEQPWWADDYTDARRKRDRELFA